MFGNKYERFTEHRNQMPPEDNLRWMREQGLLLEVYLKTDAGWKFVDYFNTVGPLVTRDLVMPIDISGINSDEVTIKLQAGFDFWDIDYAALDFSENIPIDVMYVKTSLAVDENGNDVSAPLRDNDDKYLEQPDVGNKAILTFPVVPCSDSLIQTVILHTKGYYTKIRDYKGKPDITFLKQFKEPGAFTKYSKKRYYEVCDEIGIKDLIVSNPR